MKDLIVQFKYKEFSESLINWYKVIKRDLPWRMNQDPYRIWISEIMLQQTQVITTIPFFNRFMEKFPTIESLAKADEQEVLKAWEGLGYYSRARNIHFTAKEIVKKYNGEFPRDYASIINLKGIGSYTAGAISSIAFNQPKPAVDGNVMRVMSRVLTIDDDISLAKTKKQFELIIEEIISQTDPSSYNQGLMELGALICKPKNPLCDQCPVQGFCKAYQTDQVSLLPVKTSKTKQVEEFLVTGLLRDDENRYLMRKRSEEGLLANLWEFVQVDGTDFSELEAYLESHQIHCVSNEPIGEKKHVFSHRIWQMSLYSGFIQVKQMTNPHFKLVSKEEMKELPISTAHRKLIRYC